MLTDDEQEHRMKLEYQAYLEEEALFLRELGLVKDELVPSSEQVAVAWPVAGVLCVCVLPFR